MSTPLNKPPKVGATGRFPDGKLNEDDEGELVLGIARHPGTGEVHIHFGKPVAWFALPPDQAIEFAEAIISKAKGR